jgi:hypothetical protein
MTKLDKLKELNATIKVVLKEYETRLFIENAQDISVIDKNIKEEKPQVIIELK